MTRITSLILIATLSTASGVAAQDAAETQLAPRIATQDQPGTTSIFDPSTGLLTTTTVTNTSIITMVTVAVSGVLVAFAVEAIAEDDDGSGGSDGTSATGS